MPIQNSVLMVPLVLRGKRLDQALAQLYPDYSRSRLQSWIKAGYITVNDQVASQRFILHGGEKIAINIDTEPVQKLHQKEPIPLDFIDMDNDIIIINKPPGLVVHPGAGNPQHTLLNALLYHFPELEQLPRAGIVQRLDKDTSGIMIVARSLRAHTNLVKQLQKRTITREYQSIVQGVITAGGTVDAPIGRHPVRRISMAVVDSGKQAITHYKVLKKFTAHSFIQVRLESGRTHQIRVHMAHLRHPVVGDPVYGGRPKFPRLANPELMQALQQFPRQALHASRLKVMHPSKGVEMGWQAPLPADMNKLLKLLENNA
jgi:23S rRNA pseudouridine1911/1915/1917 synthase